MKFVYFGYDFMLPAVHRLINDGHELLGVFTFNCDNIFNFNIDTIALGEELGIPVILEQPNINHINEFIVRGCKTFIAAGFPAKIPPPDEKQAYAINLHPSLLPKGRGIMPTPHIIINAPEAAGVSIHKLTNNFDAGDILLQEPLVLEPDETVDSYSARIAQRGPDMLSKVMADLPRYWAEATPQDPAQASWFPPPDDAMRTIDWNAPVTQIDKIGSAFGRFGSLAHVNGDLIAIYDYAIDKTPPDQPPGTITGQNNNQITVAAADGYIRIKRYETLNQKRA